VGQRLCRKANELIRIINGQYVSNKTPKIEIKCSHFILLFSQTPVHTFAGSRAAGTVTGMELKFVRSLDTYEAIKTP